MSQTCDVRRLEHHSDMTFVVNASNKPVHTHSRDSSVSFHIVLCCLILFFLFSYSFEDLHFQNIDLLVPQVLVRTQYLPASIGRNLPLCQPMKQPTGVVSAGMSS